jgi:hypothetical protein
MVKNHGDKKSKKLLHPTVQLLEEVDIPTVL